MNDIVIRFNRGRMVAVFDNQDDLNRWLDMYGDDFTEPFMYTIHGLGDITTVEDYQKKLQKDLVV